MKKSLQRGMTLIELMVVVAIVAVLAVIAVPNLETFLVRSQRQQVMSDLTSALAYTRSEAIKRGSPVTLAAINTGTQQLQEGWQIFTDPERTATYSASSGSLTTLLAQQDAYPTGQVKVGRLPAPDPKTSAGNEYFHFDAMGRVTTIIGASGMTGVTVAVLRGSTEKAKSSLCIGWAGRIRSVEDKANNDTGGCG